MGGGQTSFGGGAMATGLLTDGEGHQVGHGVDSSTKVATRILEGGGDLKGSQLDRQYVDGG